MEHIAILHRTSMVVWLWRSRYAREMATGITPSEQFVFHVCRESFLSLWSCANPRGKTAGKELTDILVVCDPDIVLVSVKEIGLSKTDDPIVQWQRWRKKAIEESADQLYGAERILRTTTNVVHADGTTGLAIPPVDRLRVHRIAVAFGSQGKVPLEFGDLGKGFVHVLDERSFAILLRELDTITGLHNIPEPQGTILGDDVGEDRGW